MQKPYVCPYCHKKYSVPPKACSCESFPIEEETRYYFLIKDPKELEVYQSIIDIGTNEVIKEITEDEFINKEKKGYYVEEVYIPGIETLGTFKRKIIKID